MQFDCVIRNGLIVDGTGAEPFVGDLAIKDGRIAAIGNFEGSAGEEIDAGGRIVTPGFVDIHTHYDGHVVWAERLNPSSFHGVTTIVMGNCGVGFAPCRPQDRDRLVKLMEGVEDIPEIVLTTGLTWDWEDFPEFLNRLEQRRYDMDVATYLPHAPLRVFVMGERAAAKEPATAEDIARMRALATEAVRAGALGFSTSRSINHVSRDGWLTPSYAASEQELAEIASGLEDAGGGIVQLISDFDEIEPEFAMLRRVGEKTRRPVSLSVMEQPYAPTRWRKLLDLIQEANDNGVAMTGQIAPRPIGGLLGLELYQNAFSYCPSYQQIAHLPFDRRLELMHDPDLRERIIAEWPESVDAKRATFWQFDNLFAMEDRPNYEPGFEESIAGMAAARGMEPVQLAYDITIADGGKRLIYMPAMNYVGGRVDAVRAMLDHDHTIIGLGDGGAHCSIICDASFPTYVMARWAGEGEDRISLQRAVKALTADTAQVVGLNDRGRLKTGLRADINIINADDVGLFTPHMVYDLPEGGGRLRQLASGYDYTIVAGEVTYRNGEATGALPGRLVRGARG